VLAAADVADSAALAPCRDAIADLAHRIVCANAGSAARGFLELTETSGRNHATSTSRVWKTIRRRATHDRTGSWRLIS